MIIYKAENRVNGKRYIGQSEQDFKLRQSQHKYNAFTRKTNTAFYNALRKYGWEAFEWSIIDTAETREELNEKENHWIEFYHTFSTKGKIFFEGVVGGYNSKVGGKDTSELSDESREKQRQSLIETWQKKVDSGVVEGTSLTIKQVVEIKKILISGTGGSHRSLAEKFGVGKTVITRINNGTGFNYIDVDGWKEYQELKDKSWYTQSLSVEQNKMLVSLFKEDKKVKEVVEIMGISETKIRTCYRKYKEKGVED